jgi:hypothetical protein
MEDTIEAVALSYADLSKEELVKMLDNRDKWEEEQDKQIAAKDKSIDKLYMELRALEDAANSAIAKLEKFHQGRFDAILTIVKSIETLSEQFSFNDKEEVNAV